MSTLIDRAAELLDAYASATDEHGIGSLESIALRYAAIEAIGAALEASYHAGARAGAAHVVAVIDARVEFERERERETIAINVPGEPIGPWGAS